MLMSTVSDLLRAADPLRVEPEPNERERARIRQAAIVAASQAATLSTVWFRAPLAVLAAMVVIVIGVLAAGSRGGPHGSAIVYAAVRFEVRLAEDRPGPGLREARVTGTDRSVYLHDEVVVTNADIERSSVVAAGSPSRFDIGVRFNTAGAEKMRRATASHVGRPIAVLIDGEVVMAPTLRDPIDDSALITGDYSRAEAERIVNGIGVR
jgi:hypothetical protein